MTSTYEMREYTPEESATLDQLNKLSQYCDDCAHKLAAYAQKARQELHQNGILSAADMERIDAIITPRYDTYNRWGNAAHHKALAIQWAAGRPRLYPPKFSPTVTPEQEALIEQALRNMQGLDWQELHDVVDVDA